MLISLTFIILILVINLIFVTDIIYVSLAYFEIVSMKQNNLDTLINLKKIYKIVF